MTFKISIFVPPALKRNMGLVDDLYAQQLAIVMAPVAAKMVADMKAQLYDGHGYDTGKLSNSLTFDLVNIAQNPGFDVLAKDVDYWRYVSFGHFLANGGWWEGYHFVENAMEGMLSSLDEAARAAWVTTAAMINSTTAGGMLR